jgi:hypothetical protein
MAFHAAEFMAIALTARDRAAEARRLDLSSTPPDALVSIVMAAAATEAFINELQGYYGLEEISDSLQPTELACAEALAEVERSRGSTELKYLVASLTLSGQMFDKARQPFQDFSILMTVRNNLMHPKPLDRFDDSGRVMVPPRFMHDFEQRKMTYQRDAQTSVSWLNLLETEKVASWACQAAIEIIVSVINIAPANPLIETWGGFFSGHYKTWAYQRPLRDG